MDKKYKNSYSFNPLWGEIVSKFDDGVLETFEFTKNNQTFSFQYIRRDIADSIFSLEKEKYFDIITPFDYGGFYYTDEAVLKKGLLVFEKKCKKENIISSFFRFNPIIIQNYEIIQNYIDVIKLQEHIVIDLQNEYTDEFSKRKKRNIKKAKKEDYEFIIDDNIDNFYKVYIESMDRLDAHKYFKFDKAILYDLCYFGKIFSIKYKNKIVTSLFIIEDDKNIYYFLGGTLSDYLRFGFNSLLFELVSDYYSSSKKLFFLGGGKDGLYQYKSEFSTSRVPFYIGKKIYNQEIYDELVLKTKNQENDFFPKYRKKTI